VLTFFHNPAAVGYSPIQRLVTSSVGDADALYRLLVRMALTDNSHGAYAARHAMAALSFRHLGRADTASWHQLEAMRELQVAIENPVDPDNALRMMAVSMLLNIFEVSRTLLCFELRHPARNIKWSLLLIQYRVMMDRLSALTAPHLVGPSFSVAAKEFHGTYTEPILRMKEILPSFLTGYSIMMSCTSSVFAISSIG